MSYLTRFKTETGEYYKVRIYERGSRAGFCQCCGQRRFGVLCRFIEPVKKDGIVCFECLVGIADTEPGKKPVEDPNIICINLDECGLTEKMVQTAVKRYQEERDKRKRALKRKKTKRASKKRK